MSLTERMPTPTVTDTTSAIDDTPGHALLRGIAFGLPLSLLLWLALGILLKSALS